MLCTPEGWILFVFFFNDTATTEIYTLSLHDALPISGSSRGKRRPFPRRGRAPKGRARCRGDGSDPPATPRKNPRRDRKSTRLNSSHANISYAVFCLKKKTP